MRMLSEVIFRSRYQMKRAYDHNKLRETSEIDGARTPCEDVRSDWIFFFESSHNNIRIRVDRAMIRSDMLYHTADD